MSPHFMSQSSLPVDEKFDAVWLGFLEIQGTRRIA